MFWPRLVVAGAHGHGGFQLLLVLQALSGRPCDGRLLDGLLRREATEGCSDHHDKGVYMRSLTFTGPNAELIRS
jgi:hypothetical protein